MNTSVIPVAIVGNDPVTDLLAQRIQQRKDLNLIAQAPLAEQPPADCGCLLFVPSQADINEGVAETRLLALLVPWITGAPEPPYSSGMNIPR